MRSGESSAAFRIDELDLPTCIIVGEDDPATPVSASETIRERIGKSTLAILFSTRHLSNVEQAETFNERLLEFLKSVG